MAETEPLSYWQKTAPHHTFSSDLPSFADVVIVGGGLPGAATCYWAARAQLFPQLSGLRVAQRWAGLMAFTPDLLPVIDSLPDIPNALVVGGFSGHGMPFGLRVGQVLVEAATKKLTPSALLPFQLDRATLK